MNNETHRPQRSPRHQEEHARNEFIPIDAEEDRRLRNAIPSRSHKAAKEEPVFEDNTGDLNVDLHIERIPGITNVTIR